MYGQAKKPWEEDWSQPGVQVTPPDPRRPYQLQQEQGQAAAAPYAAPKAALDVQRAQQEIQSQPLQNEQTRASIQNSQQSVLSAEQQRLLARQNAEQDFGQKFRNRPEAQSFSTIAQQYASALRAARTDNKAADLDLINAYAKILDPGSVVRENEAASAADVGGVQERLKGYFSQLQGGGRLTPEQRNEIIGQIHNRASSAADQYRLFRQQAGDAAKQYGYDPERALGPNPAQPFQQLEADYFGHPIKNGNSFVQPGAISHPGGRDKNPGPLDPEGVGDIGFNQSAQGLPPHAQEAQRDIQEAIASGTLRTADQIVGYAKGKWQFDVDPKTAAAAIESIHKGGAFSVGTPQYRPDIKDARGTKEADQKLALQHMAAGGGPLGIGSIVQGADQLFGPQKSDAFLRGVADIPSFGMSEELMSGFDPRQLARENAIRDYDKENNFKTRLGGQILGGMALPTGIAGEARQAGTSALRGGMGRLEALQAAGRAGSLQAGKEGAIYGGLYGAGSTDGDLGQRALGAGENAALGGATGYVGGRVLGSLFGRVRTPPAPDRNAAALERGFSRNIVHDTPAIQVGSPRDGALMTQPGYAYRIISPQELKDAQKTGYILPSEQGGRYGGGKYWVKGGEQFFNPDNRPVVQVPLGKVSPESPVSIRDVQVLKSGRDWQPRHGLFGSPYARNRPSAEGLPPLVDPATGQINEPLEAASAAQRYAAGQKAGVQLPYGSAGARTAAWLEKGLDASPASAGVMEDGRNVLARQVDNGLSSVRAAYGDATTLDAGGRAAQSGAKNWLGRFDRVTKKVYDAIPIHPTAQATLQNTREALSGMLNIFQSNPKMREIFQNGTLKRYLQALDEQPDAADEAGQANPLAGVLRTLGRTTDAGAGELSWQDLKHFRSIIGEQIGDQRFSDSPLKSQMRGLYGALSEDMRATAASRGPRALHAFERANDFYRQGQDRIDGALVRILGDDSKNTPEAAAAAIQTIARSGRGSSNIQQLTAIRSSLRKGDDWNEVASSLINLMGRPANSGGRNFDPEAFVRNYSDMSEPARNLLFGDGGRGRLRQKLDEFVMVSQRLARTDALRNKSNTAPVGIAAGTIIGSSATTAASLGHPVGAAITALTAAGGAAVNYSAAKLWTNPDFVQWATGYTKLMANGKPSAQAAWVNRLNTVARAEPAIANDVLGLQQQLKQSLGAQFTDRAAASDTDEQKRRYRY
jgi:hypothetical protein